MRSNQVRLVGLGIASLLAALVCVLPMRAASARAAGRDCGGNDARHLDRLFRRQVGRIVGGDYVRGFRLPSGDTLFLLQDVFVAATDDAEVDDLARAGFAHNAGVVVSAEGCAVTTLFGGRSYIGGDLTRRLSRWFWAMGGDMGADGLLHVMVAEMRNPNGTGAAMGALPVATWHATIDPVTFDVRSFAPAADASADLYGWAVASDTNYTYLYAHCYRQFVPGTYLGYDTACSSRVTVARVPRGHFESIPMYFAGGQWVRDRLRATPLGFPGERAVNPVSVQYLDGEFFSASKEGDWWGTTIYVDRSTSPTGPWTTVAKLTPSERCGDCNTYFASLMPWRDRHGEVVIALSNNAWDMHKVAYANPWIYRPSFLRALGGVDQRAAPC
jgi:hypothetical protein